MYQQPPLTVSDIFNHPFDSIVVRSDSIKMENQQNSRLANAFQRLREEQNGPMRDHVYNYNGNRSYNPYPRHFDNRPPSQDPAPHHHHHHPHHHHHRQMKNEPEWTSNEHSDPTGRETGLQVSRRLNGKQKYFLTKIYVECKDGTDWTEVTQQFNAERSRGQIVWSEVDVVTAFETVVHGTTLPDGKAKQAQSDLAAFWARNRLPQDSRNGFATRRLTSFQVQLLFDVYTMSEGRIEWAALVSRFNRRKPPQQIKWDEIEMVTTYETFALGANLSNCHQCRGQARKNISKFWRTTHRLH